jgi:MFS family permease
METENKRLKLLSDSAWMRWGVLLLISFAMAVNYWFYDVLSPIQEDIIKKLGLSEAEYGSIIAVYSIPNTFFLMAAIGGMICDRLGIRLSGTTFFFSMVLGSLLTYYGTTEYFNQGGLGYDFLNSFWTAHSPAFKVMAAGFFLFGLGAETTCVVVSKIVIKWFRGREMATALGINVGIARVASSLTFSVGAWLSDPVWNRPVLLGVLLMIAGFLALLVYLFIDVAYDRRAGAQAELKGEEKFQLIDALRLLLQPSYLYVALLCVTFYSGVFPFNKYAVDLMQNKFLMSRQTAGFIVSILPLAQAAITPLFGLVFDYQGKGATMMLIGSLCMVAGHGLLSLTSLHPAVALVFLGIAFSLVPAVLWPALAKIVDEPRLGSAYGLTFTIQNFGLMATTALIGIVLGATNPGVAEAKRFCDQATLEQAEPQLEKIVPACQKFLAEIKDVSQPDRPHPAKVKELVQSCSRASADSLPQDEVAAVKGSCASVKYDYTYPILMLAIFGLLGVLFSMLLKAADRRTGTGLELPNKQPASK